MNANDIVRNFYTDMALADDRAKAFQAVAQGVADSSGLITIQRIESLNPDLEHYGRLRGFATADQDYVLCLETRGGGTVVLGTLQNTAPTGYSLDAPLTLTDLIRYGNTGSVTYSTLTAMGTTAAVNSSAGGSWHGEMAFTPGGTGIASGSQAQINFGSTLADTHYDLVIVPRNAAAGGILWYTATRGTTAVSFGSTTALTSGTLYAISYIVIGR